MFKKTRGYVFKETRMIHYTVTVPHHHRIWLKSVLPLSQLGSLPAWLNCTILVLTNFADPHMVAIKCSQIVLLHVMCTNQFGINKSKSQLQKTIEIAPGLSSCHNTHFLKKHICFSMEWHNTTSLKCDWDPDLLSVLFDAVQASTSPPLVQDLNLVTRILYYNKHNYTKLHRNQPYGGLCTQRHRVLSIRRTGANVLNCSEIFNHKVRTFVRIKRLHSPETYCRRKQVTTHNSECSSSNKSSLTVKCKYLTTKGSKQSCSPLLATMSNGDCKIHSAPKLAHINNENLSDVQCKSGKHIHTALVDDLVEDCMFEGDDEKLLKSMMQKFVFHKCEHQYQVPCREGHSQCFNVSAICQYRLNSLGYLVPCRTGEHVQDCKNFAFNQMFKCVDFYCIPWDYVCDGKWNCPEGADEDAMHKCGSHRICFDLFCCRKSQICIHLKTICDGVIQCPHSDDEELCDLKNAFCPEHCKCVTYAVYCFKKLIHSQFANNFLPFGVLMFEHSSISGKPDLAHVAKMHISSSHIDPNNICHWLDQQSKLQYFSVLFTPIDNFLSKCFSEVQHIISIEVRNTNISQVKSDVFFNFPHLICVNLSGNPIQSFSDKAFFHVPKLKLLGLKNSFNFHFLAVHKIFFDLNLQVLETDTNYLCCFLQKEAECSVTVSWYSSCTRLLQNITLRILFGVLAFGIFKLNAISATLHIFTLHKASRTAGIFASLVTLANTSDIALSIPFLLCG